MFDYATYCTKRDQTRLTFLRFSVECLLGLRYINLCIVNLCFVYSRSPEVNSFNSDLAFKFLLSLFGNSVFSGLIIYDSLMS